jgi:hypothetical protein
MSGSTDPILKSMEVIITDKEYASINQGECPNCKSGAIYKNNSSEVSLIIQQLKYYIKCDSCLTDYTVYLKIRHITHIATFKNGERIKCQKEISKIAQAQQNLKNTKDAKKDTPKKNKAKPE